MELGRGTFLEKGSPPQFPSFSSPKVFVFIESLLPVFPVARVRAISFGRFFMDEGGKREMGKLEREEIREVGRETAICLAWRLYARVSPY